MKFIELQEAECTDNEFTTNKISISVDHIVRVCPSGFEGKTSIQFVDGYALINEEYSKVMEKLKG